MAGRVHLEVFNVTPNLTKSFSGSSHQNLSHENDTVTSPGLQAPPVIPAYIYLFLHVSFVIRVLVIPISCLGLVTNPINVAVFAKLNDTVSISLLAMAIADFLVCFTTLFGAIGEFKEVQKALLIYLSVHPREMTYLFCAFPNSHFGRITLTISAFITLERCLCVAMPLKVKMIFTSRRCKIIMVFCFLINLAQGVPNYYSYIFEWRFYPPLNKSILGYTTKEGFKEKIKFTGPFVLSYFYINFTIIVICTLILIAVLNRKRSWRKSVTTTTTAASSKDSNQVSSKEMKVIKMMVMVSSLFIVCNLPTTSIYLANEIDTSISMEGSKRHLYFLLGYVAISIQTINSSVNIFIYYFYSTNFRVIFDKMFGIKGKEEVNISVGTKPN